MAQIYKIQNKENGKVYIGQTMSTLEWRLNSTWIGHFYMAFQKNSNMLIHKALRKHGKDAFTYEVLEENLEGTFEELHKWLDERETYWIDKYDSRNRSHGYNLAKGGQHCYRHKVLSDEVREKRKNSYRQTLLKEGSKKWINNGEKTKQVYSRHLESFLSEGWSLGRLPMNRVAPPKVWTEEEKAAQSKRLKGKKKPASYSKYLAERNKQQWMRDKVSKANTGKKMSEKSKQLLSLAFKGKKLTEEQKASRRKTREANKELKGKKVWINNGTITKWVYQIEVEQYLNLGYTLGRLKMKKHIQERQKRVYTEEQRKRMSEQSRLAQLGKKHIHKGDIVKYVNKEQLEQYLNDGWVLGRGSKKS